MHAGGKRAGCVRLAGRGIEGRVSSVDGVSGGIQAGCGGLKATGKRISDALQQREAFLQYSILE